MSILIEVNNRHYGPFDIPSVGASNKDGALKGARYLEEVMDVFLKRSEARRRSAA